MLLKLRGGANQAVCAPVGASVYAGYLHSARQDLPVSLYSWVQICKAQGRQQYPIIRASSSRRRTGPGLQNGCDGGVTRWYARYMCVSTRGVNPKAWYHTEFIEISRGNGSPPTATTVYVGDDTVRSYSPRGDRTRLDVSVGSVSVQGLEPAETLPPRWLQGQTGEQH